MTLRTAQWTMLVVPASLYFFSYLHRVAPAVVAEDLMRAFAITAATLGTLAAIYPYVFAAMALVGGGLADTLGARWDHGARRSNDGPRRGALRRRSHLRGRVPGPPARGPRRLGDPDRLAEPRRRVVPSRRVRDGLGLDADGGQPGRAGRLRAAGDAGRRHRLAGHVRADRRRDLPAGPGGAPPGARPP